MPLRCDVHLQEPPRRPLHHCHPHPHHRSLLQPPESQPSVLWPRPAPVVQFVLLLWRPLLAPQPCWREERKRKRTRFSSFSSFSSCPAPFWKLLFWGCCPILLRRPASHAIPARALQP